MLPLAPRIMRMGGATARRVSVCAGSVRAVVVVPSVGTSASASPMWAEQGSCAAAWQRPQLHRRFSTAKPAVTGSAAAAKSGASAKAAGDGGGGGAAEAGREMHFNDSNYTLPHPVWTKEELESVAIKHVPPQGVVEHLAYYLMKCLKVGFDVASGFKFGTHDERAWLTRIIFLETVAGVPGMVGAAVRHLTSLRRMQRDQGWIHTLMEDAENERMHLLTALSLRKPGPLFRAAVIGGQGAFVTFFFFSYLISPRFCHRFVAYLEETAVQTYTQCLEELDAGQLPMWSRLAAPEIAVNYWKLAPDATMRDVIANIRADEMHHREIHHTFADLTRDGGGANPFQPGQAREHGR